LIEGFGNIAQLIQIVAIGVSIACGVAVFLYFTSSKSGEVNRQTVNLASNIRLSENETLHPIVVYLPESMFRSLTASTQPVETQGREERKPGTEPTEPARQRLIQRVGVNEKKQKH